MRPGVIRVAYHYLLHLGELVHSPDPPVRQSVSAYLAPEALRHSDHLYRKFRGLDYLVHPHRC